MKRTRIIFGFIVVTAIVAAAIAPRVRFEQRSKVPDLTGWWKSYRSQFNISRQGDEYRIVVDNPDGLLGGIYSGRLRGDAIQVKGPLAPLCPEIDYAADTRSLEFCGEEFARTPAPSAQ